MIHPGDVQIVRAIGSPPPGSPFEKEPLPNAVVFSIKGKTAFLHRVACKFSNAVQVTDQFLQKPGVEISTGMS